MVIGITGNIGSGKSTVARVFEHHGAVVIEGDALGHEIVERFPKYRDWLTHRFGSHIWHKDGSLDRKELGRLAFADQSSRDELTRESWKWIKTLLAERISAVLNSGKVAVVDAAMIYEWNDADRYDKIVAVVIDPVRGAQRAAERLGQSAELMMDRYATQIPAEEKASRADHVLRNDGGLEDLRRSAEELWTQLTSKP